jgi:copper chaperone CopZ
MSGPNENANWKMAGAVAGALLISLCFALPPVGEAVGAMGPRATALFAPWRPYFTVLTFLLLGAAFLMRHGERRSSVDSAEGMRRRSPAPLWRMPFWPACLAIITLSAFPYVYPRAASRIVRRQAPARVVQRDPNVRVVLKIEGMDCIMCAAGLQNNLRGLKGVREAEVSFQDGQAVIDYDPGAASVADFQRAIAASGFKVAASGP